MLTYEYHNPVWVTGPEIGGLTITNPVGQGHAKDKLGRNNELTYTILNGYRKGGEYQRLSISCFLVATAYPKQTLAEIANVSRMMIIVIIIINIIIIVMIIMANLTH